MTKPLILVVDDDRDLADMLEGMLRQVGYETSIATDGNRALEALSRGRLPGLILLDIMLPMKDGFMVLDAVKQDPDTKDIPVLIISALNKVAEVDKAIHLGAAEFLSKPLERQGLLNKISKHLTTS